MKKILILWFLAIGMANAQNIRIGVINKDTTTRPITDLAALAWRNNNLYIVKPTGNTVKFLQNDSRLWVGDNNRVGVGTKTPSQPFEVAGNAKISGSLQIGVGAGIIRSDANGLLSTTSITTNDLPNLGGLYLPINGGGNVIGDIGTNGSLRIFSPTDNRYETRFDKSFERFSISQYFTGSGFFQGYDYPDIFNIYDNKVGINNTFPLVELDVTGSEKISGNLELNDIPNVRAAINSKIARTLADSSYLSINNGGISGGSLGTKESFRIFSPNDNRYETRFDKTDERFSISQYFTGSGMFSGYTNLDVFNILDNKIGINNSFPSVDLDVTGATKISGNLELNDIPDVRTAINAKLSTTTAASTYAPINNPTFTGTAILPSTTSIGSVSNIEISYVDGVTSAIQTQLNSKLSSVSLTTNVTGILPVSNGGTGISSFGSGIATFLGTPSSANLAAALTSKTGTGNVVFSDGGTHTGTTNIATIVNTLGATFASLSGNVGIGGTAAAKLHVFGNQLIEGASGAELRVYNTSDANRAGYFSVTGDGDFSNRFINIGSSSTAYGFRIFNGATEFIRINNNGNVGIGIGTTNANQKLVVKGAIGFAYTDNLAYNGIKLSSDNLALEFWNGITSSASNNAYRFADNNGSYKVVIQNGGNVGIGTTTPNSLLHNSGSESNAITTISAATTLGEHYYIIASGASTYLVTLPSASVCTGRTYVIKTTTANKTVSSFLNASGTSTTTLTAGTTIYVVSDGTNWQQF